MLIFDAHLDLSYNALDRGRDVRRPAAEQPMAGNEIATVGLPDIRRGGISLICATIFCSPGTYGNRKGYATPDEAHAVANRHLGWYRRQIDDGLMQMVKRPADLSSTSSSDPLKFILLLEGADCMRSDADVKTWFDAGLRIVGLAWRKTWMAGGTGFPGPLTDAGRAVVRAMDKLKMIHDLSHLADESFWQLLEMSDGPVIASHSNCRAIVPGDRQLSDEMIKAIIARGGVIGIVFYDEFLLPPDQYKKRKATLDDLIGHMKHMCDLAGSAKHVAIGSDMDGGVGRDDIPHELTTIGDMPIVADALSAAGFSDEDVRGIMGENWLRCFQKHLPE